MVRASSPPEADVARGIRGSPGLAPSRKATWSAGPSPPRAISNRAEGMASWCRVDSIRSASTGAAARRAAATSAPRRSSSARADSISVSSAWARRSSPSAAARRARASSAKARTSSRVSPYFRRSWWRSWRRPGPPPGARDRPPRSPPPTGARTGQVGRVGHGRPDPGVQAGQRRTPVEGPGGLGQPVEGTGPLRSRHRGEGRGRGLAVGGRLGQPVLLGLEPGVLAGVLDARSLDLPDLVAEQVDLAGPLPGVAAEGLGLVGQPAELEAGRGAARSRSISPKASRARRWASVWTSDWCWCWPWSSIRTAGRLGQRGRWWPCARRPRPGSGPPAGTERASVTSRAPSSGGVAVGGVPAPGSRRRAPAANGR